MSSNGRFSRREVRVSVLAGVVAALLVVVAGAALAVLTHPKWTAEAVLVVLPSADLDTADSAAYYETLSRGQIVATFAEVADNLRFQDQAEQNLQLTDAQRVGVSTTVTVVPDTSVILVRTTAGTAAVAEQMTDATTTVASSYLAGLSEPYRTDLVRGAGGTAIAAGTSPVTLLGLSVVVALVVGVAVQQAVYHLMTSMGPARKREARPAGAADPDTLPDDDVRPDDHPIRSDPAVRDGTALRDDDRAEPADRSQTENRFQESMVGHHGS